MDRRTWIIVAAIVALLLLAGGGAVVAVKVAASHSEEEKLKQLRPEVRAAFEKGRALCAAQGIKILVGSTRRTDEEQAAILAKGTSATKNSFHLLGRAIDVYPYGPDGKADLAGTNTELFRKMQQIFGTVGFTNLAFNADGSKRYITGSKGPVWDGGHIQFSQGMTFAQAAARDGVKVA